MEARLKTKIWVQALLRRLEGEGYMAALCASGDADAGAVLIKVNRFNAGCCVYSQVRDEAGQLVWLVGSGAEDVPETDADAYIRRQQSYDADLWVVEIEDPKATYEIDGPLLAE